jgi:dipicolinate synthase subunit B
MSLAGKRIGFGLTGSHHTYSKAFKIMEKLVSDQVEVIPIVSHTVMTMDTKFGKGAEHIEKIEAITGKKVISTIPDAEPLGPDYPLDCLIIAPLTGNSLSKLANAHTDNAVLMAAKSTIRNEKPIILGITTNDALGLNGVNLMRLMNSKHVFFIPFGQDNPFKKPNSLVADLDYLEAAVTSALEGKQLQPVIIPFIR